MHYVVAYDITDDRMRLRAGKILDDYGTRVQESVFELADLEPDTWALCQERLRDNVSLAKGDSIRIYALCDTCRLRILAIGKGPPPMDAPKRYIV